MLERQSAIHTSASLTRLRRRLTAWYSGTLALVLVVLNAALFTAIHHEITLDLDRSLRAATREIMAAAATQEREVEQNPTAPSDAVAELRIPDRSLYLLHSDATPMVPRAVPVWVHDIALRVRQASPVSDDADVHNDETLRLYAERFTLRSGPFIAVATANQVELEDRFSTLIFLFTASTVIALLLVIGGGYILAGKSIAPVETMIAYMRRFMADAAHELRTPLTVLRSQAEVALQRPRDAQESAVAFSGIAREAERMGHIVNDLLTLARADAGERPLAVESISMDDVVLDAATTARALAQRRNVSLSLDAFDDVTIVGDASLVRQLVVILLDNAIKFTPPGGSVRLSAGFVAGQPTVTVEDSGCGIAPSEIPRVFDRFYRGESARSGGEGAGLGLAIAQWIVAAHHGKIAISTARGAGTRVTVTFPAATASGPVESVMNT